MANYRLYFDSHANAPYIWSIDAGDISTERNIAAFVAQNITFTSHYEPNADNVNNPKAWLAVESAELTIEDGIAYLRGI